MEEKVFNDCLNKWMNSDGKTPFWKKLADKYGYNNGESIRIDFKNERRRRGIKKKHNNNKVINYDIPKILCFDIETTPILCYSWGIWNQNISTDAIVQDWHILSWASKWLFDSKVEGEVLTEEEARKHDDERIVKEMWKRLDEADIVIVHNARFDIPRLNTRFLYHGLNPPSYYKVIDTLKVARKNFGFTSNKLDYINSYLGLPVKTETGLKLWIDCYNGDSESLDTMLEYNRNDVLILDAFYDGDILTADDVAALKTKVNGDDRLVISYLSIGEAEDYRYYWHNSWKSNPPSWLVEENPEWHGNYKVRYWDSAWQEIVYGTDNSYLDKIMDAGFDGVYLDIIDAFEYFENQ